MLKLKQYGKGFKAFFKNYLFLEHNDENPCFKIGKSIARFKSRNAEFKIKEKLLYSKILFKYQVISQDNNKFIIEFSSKEEKLTVVFIVIDDSLEIHFNCSNQNINRIWIKIPADQNEAIYGCGEQYSELNLRGKELPLWVEEQGIGRGDPPITGDWYTTYYPQPTFISSNNYFCHFESSTYARFNFTQNNYHEFYLWSVPEKVIFGKYDSALETISHLSNYLGRQPELPDWVYNGVWLGVQGGKEIVDEKIKKCLDKDIKIAAVWCQDWQGIRMLGPSKRLLWNWKYNEVLYPNLPSYIKELNRKGIKYLGYNNSFLTLNHELHIEASKNGFLIKNQEGNDYEIKTDSGITSLIDLSNPNAIEWLKDVVKKNMINIGLSGWMADYGEYLPTDALLYSGENPEAFHNKYPTIWAKTMFEAVEESGKLEEIVFFTRAGYSNTSRYSTMVWAGDQLVGWSIHDGIASVIPAGISLGICGIGYFHFDIGGFHALDHIRRDKEVFMRWAEFAPFTMAMRTHESVRPTQNWQFDSDNETLEFFGKMSRIYVHLKPYLKKLSREYIEKGYPPFRAIYLHYENDLELHKIKYQYLFGQDILVAPVYKPDIKLWKVYLPDDVWIHVWSDKEYSKGWYEIEAPLGKAPIFFRKNSQYSELFRQIKKIN